MGGEATALSTTFAQALASSTALIQHEPRPMIVVDQPTFVAEKQAPETSAT